ncbi:hypothetical protein OpiT1DRAFT_02769 [Opitutaceae bacterium TAV1]|nr:hypothetical protein OpiT1DRAFT_02769 [Opitutaceae bacterium TAV1]
MSFLDMVTFWFQPAPYSAMQKTTSSASPAFPRFRITAFAALALAFTASSHAAFVDFADDFNNLSNWSSSAINGATAASTAGGEATLDVGVTTTNARTVIRSLRAGFNPFDQAFSIKLDGLVFGGTPGTAGTAGRNVGYVLIGRTQDATAGGNSGTANYYPGITSFADGRGMLSLSIWQRTSGNYSINLTQGAGTAWTSVFGGDIAITAAPTSIEWNLSVNASTQLLEWKVILGGAFFTDTNLSARSGVFDSSVTASLLKDAYLALGAWNNYQAVTTASSLVIDSISVTAIPEVHTVALSIGAAGLLLAGIARCCRREK